MPTEKQRREAARRHLERQLQRRQEREARRKRVTLIASVAGTLVIIGIVIALVVGLGNSNSSSAQAGGGSSSPASGASSAPTSASSSPLASPSASPARPAKGPAVSFLGVTVKGARDLGGAPQVTSKAAKPPAKLEYKDLVVGKGKPATPSSTVNVQYVGVLYKNGTKFDSSWDRGQAASFSLQQVVKGFTEGIGGTSGVPPMKVGGRRIMILPAALGYGAQATGAIPANSPLVFVVDLKGVS